MKKKSFFNRIVTSPKFIFILVSFLSLFASIQSFLLHKAQAPNGLFYTKYNNYIIFKQSFFHLIRHLDLYQLYPAEYWDPFKYSPTFSLFFGIFSYLPDCIGLILWNLLNCLLLTSAIYSLPKINLQQKSMIILIGLIELMTALQNSQSNALMAGLMIFSFVLLEKDKYLLATLLLVFSIYIKILGIVGFSIFLFYPKKWKLAAYSLLWMVVLFLLPLICSDFNQLKFLYSSWHNMLIHDTLCQTSCSIMKLFGPLFSKKNGELIVFVTGLIAFMIPFLKIKQYGNYNFRLLALTSVLLWAVLFNHKAESPTFVIAMAGVSIWFITNKISWFNIILLIIAFILTSLSPTDIFPNQWRIDYVNNYALKALPCLFIWIKILYDMMVIKKDETEYLSIADINVKISHE